MMNRVGQEGALSLLAGKSSLTRRQGEGEGRGGRGMLGLVMAPDTVQLGSSGAVQGK